MVRIQTLIQWLLKVRYAILSFIAALSEAQSN